MTSRSNIGYTGGTQADFQRRAESIIEDIMASLILKGKAYSDQEAPATENFTAGAAIMDMPPVQYLMTLVVKHIYAMARASGEPDLGKLNGETMGDRARDVIIYMLLLLYMLEEYGDG